jgi:hypothetical protein
MSDELATYLNDHLTGATFGYEHARHLDKETAATDLGEMVSSLASDIEADRDELIVLMDRLGIDRSAVKQATTRIAEKLGRPKFSGTTSGEPALGRFLALEAMSLGVEGKLCLWETLKTSPTPTRNSTPASSSASLSAPVRSVRFSNVRERPWLRRR